MTTTDKTESTVEALPNEDAPVVLSVQHVAKSFKLPTEQANGLKMAFLNWTKGIKGYKEQQVLRDITFDVHQGDFFGIVGRNGSGKSTLLKIISKIYKPEKGTVTVKGKLVPFIELGVGFNPELTGRENVYLNGALLGFTHEQIDEMYDDIVRFAELEDFMDQKLKNYSSGMQVRLAFSVAIQAQGDILVLDEVLAVGDEAFQRKCDNFFSDIKKDKTKTVILVTHDMASVKKYCNKAILIKDGEIVVNGNKDDAAGQYTLENLKAEGKEIPAEDAEQGKPEEPEYELGLSETVPVFNIRPAGSPVCTSESGFQFDIEYEYNGDEDFYIPMSVLDVKRGGIPYDCGPAIHLTERGHHVAHFTMPLTYLNSGDYRIIATIRVTETPGNFITWKQVAFTNDKNSCDFAIRNNEKEGKDYALLNDKAMNITLTKLDD
ncbi:sugar ABC transporter [Bifidobacterium primatium]|uniref:Sugar ABC transporter n=1 Tax=Bifidobacterium primatium TaxID=2045438 RepID=A0A2M9HB77_9BIFI|nr:ABC transporter ATP-binding protein [Bifidobacterium primatium]PJM74072.1 sugar ABC transporter [Bifidobacterium primatium]